MEELKQKIAEYESYISSFCQRHNLTEEDIKKMASCIKERDNFIYQTKYENWNTLQSEDIYFDKNDFKSNYVPEGINIAMIYFSNRRNYIIDEIYKNFKVDLEYIYYEGFDEEDDNDEELLEFREFSITSSEWITFCLGRKYPTKKVHHWTINGCSQGDGAEVYIVCDKDYDTKDIFLYCRDYIRGDYKQFQLEGDEVLDDGCIYTIMESELPSKDISNTKEIEEKLASFSGTGRKVVIKW